jgi:hypothetical protein
MQVWSATEPDEPVNSFAVPGVVTRSSEVLEEVPAWKSAWLVSVAQAEVGAGVLSAKSCVVVPPLLTATPPADPLLYPAADAVSE